MSYFFADAGPAPALNGASITYSRDHFRAHLAAVEALCEAGIPAPPGWTALRGRYAGFIELGNHAAERLAAEVITPTGADLATLRTVAVAEEQATGGADVAVNEQVQRAVLAELLRLYAPVAKRNYKTAADRYDEVAKRFAAAAKAVDVEAGGDRLISASGGQREAWLAVPELAAQLDAALHPLLAAAVLAGRRPDVAFLNGATDVETTEVQIALATDPGKAHRRKVWVAWSKTDGRTRRWGALAALGVKLRATGDPVGIEPYRRPEQPVTVTGPGGRIEYWDPHDGPLPPRFRPLKTGWLAETPNTAGIP